MKTTIERRDLWCLYLSHALSMWNSKTYEYATIVFVQAAFPGSLLQISILGLAETFFFLFLSSSLGAYTDTASRLHALLLSILVNRGTVVVACLTWVFILSIQNEVVRYIFFTFVLGFTVLEKASKMVNVISMERDWVPTLAAGEPVSVLTHVNSVMRRIDIGCKLLAPLATAWSVKFLTPFYSSLGIGVLSLLSYGAERWCITTVWTRVPKLQEPKDAVSTHQMSEMQSGTAHDRSFDTHEKSLVDNVLSMKAKLLTAIKVYLDQLSFFFHTVMWIPALAAGFCHASLLTYDKPLITYLLNAQFPLGTVTIAQSSASVFELGSTVVFPFAVNSLEASGILNRFSGYAPIATSDNQSDEATLARQRPSTSGNAAVVVIASIGSLMHVILLVPALTTFFFMEAYVTGSSIEGQRSLTASSTLFLIFLCISYLGRWTFDLSFTQLSQTLIPPSKRGVFAGTEAQFVSFMKLIISGLNIIWSKQDDFKWLILMSFITLTVGMASTLTWSKRWLEGASN